VRGCTVLKKDTVKIIEELGICPDFNTFYNENKDYMISETLSTMLEKLLSEKGLKKSQVIKKSELAEIYAYQIFSGVRIPERKKLLSLAVAMELDLDEVQTLLKCSGYSPLYAKRPFDSITIYGIYNKLSVIEINNILYNYKLETLG